MIQSFKTFSRFLKFSIIWIRDYYLHANISYSFRESNHVSRVVPRTALPQQRLSYPGLWHTTFIAGKQNLTTQKFSHELHARIFGNTKLEAVLWSKEY
jgi:hypothetical protein